MTKRYNSDVVDDVASMQPLAINDLVILRKGLAIFLLRRKGIL